VRTFGRQPDVKFSFEPSDIVSRVMTSLATPIEVTVSGPNLAANREHADKLRHWQVFSFVICQFQQALDYPRWR